MLLARQSTVRVTADVAGFVSIAPPHAQPADRETPQLRALIDAARAGSQEAFGELVSLHERVVMRTAMAALGVREDAEDVAQEAFVLAWQHLARFRGEATFRTWLVTIVWRRALDRRRSRQRWWHRLRHPAGDAEHDGAAQLVSTDADPERLAIDADLVRRAQEHIQQLSPKLKDTLLLACSGEHSYEEIAAILRVPLGTVKWRVSEARRVISKSLER
jgi:RNA polymerase sigma-70 factor (ECF subfamily)